MTRKLWLAFVHANKIIHEEILTESIKISLSQT